MTEIQDIEIVIIPSDIKRWTTRGTGPGGQHKNTTDSSVFLKHIPTGIVCKGENSRSQYQNEQEAYRLLKIKLYELEKGKVEGDIVAFRNNQIGTGERSDKRRTYREKDDLVIDHITNKSARLKDIMRGKINLLHKV